MKHVEQLKLKELNCSQLADWLEGNTPSNQSAAARRLRDAATPHIALLRLAPNKPANQWRQLLRSQAVALRIPSIRLELGGADSLRRSGPSVRVSEASIALLAAMGHKIEKFEGKTCIVAKRSNA